MTKKLTNTKPVKQLSLDEYAKVKGKLTQSKLKLNFPLIIKSCFIVPIVYGLFLVIYYVAHLRFLPEH